VVPMDIASIKAAASAAASGGRRAAAIPRQMRMATLAGRLIAAIISPCVLTQPAGLRRRRYAWPATTLSGPPPRLIRPRAPHASAPDTLASHHHRGRHRDAGLVGFPCHPGGPAHPRVGHRTGRTASHYRHDPPSDPGHPHQLAPPKRADSFPWGPTAGCCDVSGTGAWPSFSSPAHRTQQCRRRRPIRPLQVIDGRQHLSWPRPDRCTRWSGRQEWVRHSQLHWTQDLSAFFDAYLA
jgi:hypothetical protein